MTRKAGRGSFWVEGQAGLVSHETRAAGRSKVKVNERVEFWGRKGKTESVSKVGP